MLSSTTANDKQRKIKDAFFPSVSRTTPNRESNGKIEANNQFIFARQMALWFCRDLVPLSTVEHKGFNGFWKYLATKFELPSRATVAIGALDDLYLCCKNKLIEKLSNCTSHATITFDGWSDSHKRISYITYTYHFTENWDIKTVVLKTASFPHPHTSERIKSDYADTLAEFNLRNKNVSIVTDGAKNMIKTAELLNIYRSNCIGHIVHLLVRKDLLQNDEMQPLLNLRLKLRKIHQKLMYKHEELRDLNDAFMQDKILNMIEEHKEIGRYIVCTNLVENFNVTYFFIAIH